MKREVFLKREVEKIEWYWGESEDELMYEKCVIDYYSKMSNEEFVKKWDKLRREDFEKFGVEEKYWMEGEEEIFGKIEQIEELVICRKGLSLEQILNKGGVFEIKNQIVK